MLSVQHTDSCTTEVKCDARKDGTGPAPPAHDHDEEASGLPDPQAHRAREREGGPQDGLPHAVAAARKVRRTRIGMHGRPTPPMVCCGVGCGNPLSWCARSRDRRRCCARTRRCDRGVSPAMTELGHSVARLGARPARQSAGSASCRDRRLRLFAKAVQTADGRQLAPALPTRSQPSPLPRLAEKRRRAAPRRAATLHVRPSPARSARKAASSVVSVAKLQARAATTAARAAAAAAAAAAAVRVDQSPGTRATGLAVVPEARQQLGAAVRPPRLPSLVSSLPSPSAPLHAATRDLGRSRRRRAASGTRLPPSRRCRRLRRPSVACRPTSFGHWRAQKLPAAPKLSAPTASKRVPSVSPSRQTRSYTRARGARLLTANETDAAARAT
eukprot:365534-Chlamydomonas_euryale.AAC.6